MSTGNEIQAGDCSHSGERTIDRATGEEQCADCGEMNPIGSWPGPCGRCNGYGRRTYPNTATWRGCAGGQSLTEDLCDVCWGSGSSEHPFANPRRSQQQLEAARGLVRALHQYYDRQRLDQQEWLHWLKTALDMYDAQGGVR